jgi:hypothetical protein
LKDLCSFCGSDLPKYLYRIVLTHSPTTFDMKQKEFRAANHEQAPGDHEEMGNSLYYHFTWRSQFNNCWISFLGDLRHARAFALKTRERVAENKRHHSRHPGLLVKIPTAELLEQECIILKADRLIKYFGISVKKNVSFHDEYLVLHAASFAGPGSEVIELAHDKRFRLMKLKPSVISWQNDNPECKKAHPQGGSDRKPIHSKRRYGFINSDDSDPEQKQKFYDKLFEQQTTADSYKHKKLKSKVSDASLHAELNSPIEKKPGVVTNHKVSVVDLNDVADTKRSSED